MSLLSYRAITSRMEGKEQDLCQKRVTHQRPGPISSYELLAGAREREIVHNGERYQIKITSKGKLILTK